MSVRVRYAPSPTGSPHVGNIRTALYNFLFAQRMGGVNILRIEDTDRTRYRPEVEHELVESLHYVGVQWQEGPDVGGPFAPYKQSERKEAGIYQPVIDRLLNDGAAYWAFDTPEELDEMRLFQQVNKKPTGYFGGDWRDAPEAKAAAARESGKPGVIRLRVPRGERIVINDLIRGRIEVDSDTVDDPVLIKADGMPTYHFAAMVDDVLMEVTHVFRGDDWISSAPKHVVLWRALGVEPPQLVHLPNINGTDGKKLSKRHGDTACLDFRRAGCLGDALANFIALIGWSPGDDREVMTLEEMAAAFSLRGIQPSPGVFDRKKLDWMNSSRIRALSIDEVFSRFSAYAASPETWTYWEGRAEAEVPEGDPLAAASRAEARAALEGLKLLAACCQDDPAYAKACMALEQERVGSLAEFGPKCRFFLEDVPEMDEKALAKWKASEHAAKMLDEFANILNDLNQDSVTIERCEEMVRSYAAGKNMEKLGPVVHPLRLALTGATVGPGLWELMAVLGKERLVRRLQVNGAKFQ